MKARYLIAVALTVTLAAGASTLAHGSLSPTTSPAAAPAASLTTTMLSVKTGATGTGHTITTRPRNVGAAGWGRRAGGAGMIGQRGLGRGLTVSAVNGQTITASGWGGQQITVTVSATTVYTEAGSAATLAAVTPGSRIAVQGTRDSTGAVNATAITIVLPTMSGVVTAVNGTTLTISDFAGTAHSVTVSDGTRYQRAGQAATLADISVGTAIVAEGHSDASGTLSALRVSIRVPRVAGQVATVSASSFTLKPGFRSSASTVTTSASTLYSAPDGTALTSAAVKSGSIVMAEGTLSADGKTLTALRVIVLPSAGQSVQGTGPLGGGFGRHGHGGRGFGFFGGANGGGASGSSTTPAAPSTSAGTI